MYLGTNGQVENCVGDVSSCVEIPRHRALSNIMLIDRIWGDKCVLGWRIVGDMFSKVSA